MSRCGSARGEAKAPRRANAGQQPVYLDPRDRADEPACPNRHLKYTLSALQRLHIVTSRLDRQSDPSTDETELQMNSVFQNSFRMALTGG